MTEIQDFYFQPNTEIICGKEVPPITESHQFADDYPTVVERFFSKHYYCRDNAVDEVHTILHHSNRICLIGLDISHVAVKKGIKSINFDVGNCDRSKNQVSGKGKRGAMNLQPSSMLAIVTCNDDSEYKVVSCITGKLVEINERLGNNPELIGKDGYGYVAIVLPKMDKCADIISGLLTESDYQQKLNEHRTTN